MSDSEIVAAGVSDLAHSDDGREQQLAAALARCANGDRAALQVIYDLEAPRMIGVARRILFRRDLAEEAVHDAFIRIWHGAAGFDRQRGSARGWLYAVVRNRALSIHRDEHRYEPDDDTALNPDAEAPLARLPEQSALRRCLERIERPRRDVVVLAYAHGMSHGELAGRLKVPLGTVKSWVRRSLFALQECMG
ncbi:sigma-70 family RNA polymerase sigma factor [Rhodopseudomonas sp.]|uniref:sigma-70 family RNA polymerase sigma factor n=1 Tax=Rhodopseudomonas sp. TaxID=1078 RepID=UPI003B3B8E88